MWDRPSVLRSVDQKLKIGPAKFSVRQGEISWLKRAALPLMWRETGAYGAVRYSLG